MWRDDRFLRGARLHSQAACIICDTTDSDCSDSVVLIWLLST